MKKLNDLSIFRWEGTPQGGKYLGMEFFLHTARSSYRLLRCYFHPSDQLLRLDTCCEVNILPTAHYMRRHAPVFSLEYVKSGSLLVKQRGQGYELEPGELFLMQPGCESEFLSGPAGCHKLSLLFSGELIADFLRNSKLEKIDVMPHPDPVYFEHLFKSVMELSDNSTPRPGKNPALAFEVLQSLLYPPEPAELPALLQKLLEQLKSHPEAEWTQPEMARLCGCSGTHLVRLFHRHLQTTPWNYLKEQRMEKAHQYLLDGRLSIKEIAALCGFNDAMNFSTGFRQKFGLSPRDFRKKFEFLNSVSGE